MAIDTEINIAIAVISIIITALLTYIFHLKSKDRDSANKEKESYTIVADINKRLEILDDIKKRLESPNSFLSSSYLSFAALARQSEFWSKLYTQKPHKLLISNVIALEYIKKNDVIILDSGTTVDQIAHILFEKNIEVTIYTNNLLAAISVLPPSNNFKCFLLSGKIDPSYGATYDENITAPLRPIRVDVIVLAAASISYETGPKVKVGDHSNSLFKAELVRKSLEDGNSPKLIIAVDWTKFENDDDENFNTVLDTNMWKDLRANNNHSIVLTKPPQTQRGCDNPDIEESLAHIKLFKDNMENRDGIKVHICENHNAGQ